MNRLHVADLGRGDYPIDLQVTVGSFGRPDAIGFVGHAQVGGTAVGLAEHGHGFDAQLTTGAEDAKRDFPAIGYQDAFEHRLLPCIDFVQGLAVLHRLAVFDQHGDNLARDLGGDLVEKLHRYH